MFTIKTDINQFKKRTGKRNKKYKVLLNARRWRFWIYYYIFNESLKN
jgi:hypothetical protein